MMSELTTPPAPVPEVDLADPHWRETATAEASPTEGLWSGATPAAPGLDPTTVPELPTKPTWSGESDHRPEAGPMYPDLFQQAVAGNALANVVTVHYADGEPRPGLDVPAYSGRPSDRELVSSSSARTPAEVGAFTGASAKKRWRLHR